MNVYAAMNILMLPKHTLFICDTHVNLDPSAEQVAEMTIAGRRGGAPLRPDAEGRAVVAFQLRQP